MSFLLNISQVNALSDERFEYVFRNVIELYPAAAIEVGKKRPFNNSTELCAAFDNYLEELSTAGQFGIHELSIMLFSIISNLYSE